MRKLKLFIESYKLIIIAGAYALAITFMTALLLSWNKIPAYMLVFIVVLELTYIILKILTCEESNDNEHKGEM